MFKPVRRQVFSWSTPDPEGKWIMQAHLLLYKDSCIMVDPPWVPGIIDVIKRLGNLDAVILTTLDHTRGAKNITKDTGATLYVPDQGKSLSVNPEKILSEKNIVDYKIYGNQKLFDLEPRRIVVEGDETGSPPWIDEFSLLTESGDLIVGDIAIGTEDNRVDIAPHWFPYDPRLPNHPHAISAFSKLVQETGASSLLCSHGKDIVGGLQELV